MNCTAESRAKGEWRRRTAAAPITTAQTPSLIWSFRFSRRSPQKRPGQDLALGQRTVGPCDLGPGGGRASVGSIGALSRSTGGGAPNGAGARRLNTVFAVKTEPVRRSTGPPLMLRPPRSMFEGEPNERLHARLIRPATPGRHGRDPSPRPDEACRTFERASTGLGDRRGLSRDGFGERPVFPVDRRRRPAAASVGFTSSFPTFDLGGPPGPLSRGNPMSSRRIVVRAWAAACSRRSRRRRVARRYTRLDLSMLDWTPAPASTRGLGMVEEDRRIGTAPRATP